MPDPNHATKGSGGGYCCRCSSSLGEAVKVQPVNVDKETYCPRCFVWWRMNQPTEDMTHGQPRFNATQACAAKCQFCAWTVVSFGALPGQRLRCSHCGGAGAVPVIIPRDGLTEREREAIREAQDETRKALT